jgi:methylenetetrahydrofolate dehydrogenase (NADP+)/methenyltetrahydrofolate cyclohydrolase
MNIIDGKKIQIEILKRVKEELALLPYKPFFTDILIGSDPVNAKYVTMKKKTAEEIGFGYKDVVFDDNATTEEIVNVIQGLNEEKYMAGIIVQLPLPAQFDKQAILDAVSPEKDVDVLGSVASEFFYNNKSTLVLPTANAVIKILKSIDLDLDNKKIVILGQGPLVGKPVAYLLGNMGIPYEAVTKTTDEAVKNNLIKNADILISAMGSPHAVNSDMVKEGVIIIDAGTSEMEGSIVGDVDFASVGSKATYITPTPGGVGPVTVACLFENVLQVAKRNTHE